MDALLFHPENSKTDLQPASKVLSPVLGKHPMDLMREFSMTSGILLEEMAADQSSECQLYLAREGYKTLVVSQQDVCQLQKPNLLRSLSVSESSMECSWSNHDCSIAAENVCWLDIYDLVELHSEVQQEQQSHYLDNSYNSSLPTTSQRTSRTVVPQLEVVDDEYRIFRVDARRFDFRSTGQPIHQAARQSVLALAIALVTKCPNAEVGKGLQWIREGGLPQRQRVENEKAYVNYVRWRLTLAALEEKKSQPKHAHTAFENPRIFELEELCHQILEDGKITKAEVLALLDYLKNNQRLEHESITMLKSSLQQFLQDGRISAREREELHDVLVHIIR